MSFFSCKVVFGFCGYLSFNFCFRNFVIILRDFQWLTRVLSFILFCFSSNSFWLSRSPSWFFVGLLKIAVAFC